MLWQNIWAHPEEMFRANRTTEREFKSLAQIDGSGLRPSYKPGPCESKEGNAIKEMNNI